MKKFVCFFLSFVLITGLVACGSAQSDDPVENYLAKAGLTIADILPAGCNASDATYVENSQQIHMSAIGHDYDAWVAQVSSAFAKAAGDSFEDYEVVFCGVVDDVEVLVSIGTVNDIFYISIV